MFIAQVPKANTGVKKYTDFIVNIDKRKKNNIDKLRAEERLLCLPLQRVSDF